MNEKHSVYKKPLFIGILSVLLGFIAGNLFPVLGIRIAGIGGYRAVGATQRNLVGQRIGGQNVQFGQQRVMPRGAGFGNNTGGPRGLGVINGEVVSNDSSGVTIKTSDGTLKKITLSETTKVYKNSEIASTGIAAGDKVTVFNAGTDNGTIAVQSIIIGLPQFGGQR